MPAAILVRDLRKSYGLKAAVDGVDLEVPRGSFFGFLGPNGAGKSTTIRMLTGLIPADSGTIEILGLKLPADELEIKRKIGLVPDESLLFDRLTGVEFLESRGACMVSRVRRRSSAPAALWTSFNCRPIARSSANTPRGCANESPWPPH
jgi:ABC-type multidrug transport system ATPase subunit